MVKSNRNLLKKSIYRITVTNFHKHNSKKKYFHKYIYLSTGFLHDSKVSCLTPTGVLLFLSCLLLAGESSGSQFEVSHESLRSHSKVKSESLRSQLDQLQSLQLLTYEVLHPLINKINKINKEVEDENQKIEDSSFSENLLTTTTKNNSPFKESNSVQQFNGRFSKEFQEFSGRLKETELERELKPYVSQLVERFLTWEDFESWIVDQSTRYKPEKTNLSLTGWQGLITKCELGVVKQKHEK